MNKVILIGNIGSDPELRTIPSGNQVATASLATTEKYKNKSGEKVENTEWHNLELWGKQAEVFAQYVKKGTSVAIEGSINNQKWKDKEGNTRITPKVKVSNFHIVKWSDKTQETPKPQSVTTGDDEDLPF